MTAYLYAGCVTLILFIILLVIGKVKKGLPDYIFLAWLVILLVNVSTFIIIIRYNYPPSFTGKLLVEFSEASVFLHGPVFLFYTLSLTTANFKIRKTQVLHLVPFIVCLLVLIIGVIYNNGVSNATRQGFTIVKMAFLLAYTSRVVIQLHRHRYRVERIFSNTENKYLDWLNFLAWGIVSVWIVSIAGLLLYHFSGLNIPQYGAMAGNLALCGLVFLIGYFGVRQEAIFKFVNLDDTPSVAAEIGDTIEAAANYPVSVTEEIEEQQAGKVATQPVINDKYKKSGLTKKKSLEYFDVLTQLMQEKKPYQDSELTLFSLAEQMRIHPNHLSQIINQHCHQNFFDYINVQRVNDVKEALQSNSYNNLSLLGIANEFGFNSKASFNRAFKKFTGITPSEFRKTAL